MIIYDLSEAGKYNTDEQRNESKPNDNKILNISQEQIINLQKSDYYCKALLCYLRYELLPDKPEFRQWVLKMAPYAIIKNGMIGLMSKGEFKIMAPLALRETLMHLSHDNQLSGHTNWQRPLARLNDWFWENMETDMKSYCQNCVKCQQNNIPAGGYTKMALGKLPEVRKFNDRAHADLIGPFVNSGQLNYKYCLVITDAYSGYVKIIPLENKMAETVAKGIYNGWICHFSCPLTLTTDAGSEFTAGIMKELCKMVGCELTYASTEHAMGNGMVERQMRNLLSFLRKFIDGNPSNWSSLIDPLMASLNTSINTVRLKTPFELCFGYPPTLPTNLISKKYDESYDGFHQLVYNHFKLQEEIKRNKELAYERHKRYYDSKINQHFFKENDVVFLKCTSREMKLMPRWIGPLRVVKVKSNDNILMKHIVTGKVYSAHSNRIKMGRYDHQLTFPTGLENKEKRREENDEGEVFASHDLLPDANALPTRTGVKEYVQRDYNVEVGSHLKSGGDCQLGNEFNSPGLPMRKEVIKERDATNVHDDSKEWKGPLTRSRGKILLSEGRNLSTVMPHFNSILQLVNWQNSLKIT